MRFDAGRRGALVGLGAGVVLSSLLQSESAEAIAGPPLEPAGATSLRELSQKLAGMPRRREFKTRPMIANHPDLWDAAPLDAVLAYKGKAKQAWDNTDLTGPWLNGMRNSLNSQIWGFKEPNFLCVSATHGPAHLALYDQDMWDKYQLAKIAGGNVTRNTFILPAAASTLESADVQSPDGAYSPKSNSIAVLQRRGVVFMACHNAMWELADRLATAEQNPDHLPVDRIAAELSNHLVPDVVITPGVVATLVNLQQAGFAYNR
jgi:intracellular sulfur oxidation DsrE/DsrF family protein